MHALVERYLSVAERSHGTGPPSSSGAGFSALLEAPAVALAQIKEVAAGFEAHRVPGPGGRRMGRCRLGSRRGSSDAEEAAALAAKARALYAACSGVPMLGDVPAGVDPSARDRRHASGTGQRLSRAAHRLARPRPGRGLRVRRRRGHRRRPAGRRRADPGAGLGPRLERGFDGARPSLRRHRRLGRRPSACRRGGRRRGLGLDGRAGLGPGRRGRRRDRPRLRPCLLAAHRRS